MIKFYGRLSEKCINTTAKQQNKSVALLFLIGSIIATIITIFIGIFDFENFYYFLGLTLLLICINIMILFVPHNSITFRLQKFIIFDFTNDLITVKIEGFSEKAKPKTKKISKIKRIEDQGDWYYITFKGDFTENIICQKNLITQGTIEEFEEIFKDKIVRKYK